MGVWYAVRTNPKCEIKATRSLRRAGFGAYLPEMKIERQHHRTKAWIEKKLCLMPRYLFVDMTDDDWFTLRRCDGVQSVMGVDGVYQPMPTGTVERFMAMQANLEFDDTREAKRRHNKFSKTKTEMVCQKFPIGSRIRAKDGPFSAFGGHVTNVSAQGEVQALIEMFGRLTPVQFPADDLEIDKACEAA